MELPDNWKPHHMGYISDDATMAQVMRLRMCSRCRPLPITCPNTALESMAAGTPIVAFDVGGISDAVRHQQTGYLARPFDVIDFAQGLRHNLMDEDQRSRLGANARAVASSEYTLKQEIDAFVALYQSLLSNR